MNVLALTGPLHRGPIKSKIVLERDTQPNHFFTRSVRKFRILLVVANCGQNFRNKRRPSKRCWLDNGELLSVPHRVAPVSLEPVALPDLRATAARLPTPLTLNDQGSSAPKSSAPFRVLGRLQLEVSTMHFRKCQTSTQPLQSHGNSPIGLAILVTLGLFRRVPVFFKDLGRQYAPTSYYSPEGW